jgi:hypothetical protein
VLQGQSIISLNRLAISIAVLKFSNTWHSGQSLAGQLALSQLAANTTTTTTTTTTPTTTTTTTTTTIATELFIRYTKSVPFAGLLTHLCSTRYPPCLVAVFIKRKRVTYNHTDCLKKTR